MLLQIKEVMMMQEAIKKTGRNLGFLLYDFVVKSE